MDTSIYGSTMKNLNTFMITTGGYPISFHILLIKEVGTMTKKTVTYDSSNNIISITNFIYSYDNNNNWNFFLLIHFSTIT